MDQETGGITAEVEAAIAERPYWSFSTEGYGLAISEVPGYQFCGLTMRWGENPGIDLVVGGDGIERSCVMSKSTPPSQRAAHLGRPIEVMNSSSVTLLQLIADIYQYTGIPVDPSKVPMIDCVVCMPLPVNGKTYWAGSLNIFGGDGLMAVCDRGIWDGTYWVTDPSNKILPIAVSDRARNVQVFSIDRILNLDILLKPDGLWFNSVTAVAVISDLIIQTNPYLDSILRRLDNDGMAGGNDNRYGGPMRLCGFAGMGANADTGSRAVERSMPQHLKYPVVVNFYLYASLMRSELIDALHMLEEGSNK